MTLAVRWYSTEADNCAMQRRTQFWLGTHIYRDLLGFGGLAGVLSSGTDGTVKAGGAVMYDYRLMHRGMPNRSTDTLRPVLQFLYHRPAYKERANYGSEPLFDAPFVRESITPFVAMPL